MLSVILIGFISILRVNGAWNEYCSSLLCREEMSGEVLPHIGCPGVAESDCPPDVREIVINSYTRQMVLDKHNSYRNQLAGGLIGSLPSAKRMPTIVCGSFKV